MARDLNDSLENLFDGDMAEGGARPMAAHTPADYSHKAQQNFEEGCPACRGTGQFRSHSGRALGQCFKCKGAGKRTFKTSADSRERARASAEARKERAADDALAAFAKANPAVHAWIIESAPTFDFARAMLEAVRKFGDLTQGQLTACENAVAKRALRAAERVQQVAAAPVIDTTKIEAAFETARSGGFKKIWMNAAGLKFSPAPAAGSNAGAVYVKRTQGGEYLGKIKGGKFLCVAGNKSEIEAEVLQVASDPKAAAVAHGRMTGNCAICSRQLTDPDSVAAGIGPICATKMGW